MIPPAPDARRYFDPSKHSKKLKKGTYIVMNSREDWVLFVDGKIVAAATASPPYLYKEQAVSVVRSSRVLYIGTLPRRVAEAFLTLVPGAVFETPLPYSDFFTVQAVTVTAPDEQFTEEFEEETSLAFGAASEVQATSDVAVAPVREDTSFERPSSEVAIGGVETEVQLPSEKKVLVEDFEDYVSKLQSVKYTGVVEGSSLDLLVRIWFENGKIVGAYARNEDLELKGNDALFFLDRPLEVRAVFEPLDESYRI